MNNLLKYVLDTNGANYQKDIAKEEIAELITELSKCITSLSQLLAGVNHADRLKITLGDLCGEIADVELTIGYLKKLTDPILVDQLKAQKVLRLADSIGFEFGNVKNFEDSEEFEKDIPLLTEDENGFIKCPAENNDNIHKLVCTMCDHCYSEHIDINGPDGVYCKVG